MTSGGNGGVILPDTLKDFSFFADFSEAAVKSMATVASEISFQPGDYIVREGDAAHTLYLLLDGWVDILVNLDTQGKQRELVTTLTRGDMFGWSALVAPNRYTTSVVCASPVKAVGLKGTDLITLFEADQRLGCAFMTKVCQVIASRLRVTRHQMVSLFVIG
jgi:CRP-like cAMP-binding protein